MAKIVNPVLFSDFFNIELEQFETLGAFNPTLNVDTKLFIDPLLLENSSIELINNHANNRLTSYFEDIITLLKASSSKGDLPWREADRRMEFHEIPGTCLGYGAASIRGSAFGKKLRENLLNTAKQIISLGIENPKLFILLPLLENDIGPDRISDMTTKVILPELAKYTLHISEELSIKTEQYEFDGKTYLLPKNPIERNNTPIILIPKDILSKLPVATDWSEVADAASKNSTIRSQVNQYIGHIWQAKHRKDKKKLKENVLSSPEAFNALLNAVQCQPAPSYDFISDPSGLLSWRQLLKTISNDYPLEIQQKENLNIDSVSDIVKKINEQFQFLIEKRGLSKLLWRDKINSHHERVSQMVYFAVADSYCKANNLDITPEADTGSGAVDFKFSLGYESRVLVEIKLSTNPNVVSGYEKQLAIYAIAEKTKRATYLVIDVGRMGNKDRDILNIMNFNRSKGKPTSDIIFVDGSLKVSASKRK
ncbi:MAG: hypothetical protein PHZ02_13000 [Desulfocapsaceae bacterium]|nr:hypothetical protein [Desulfocapsaceae bacterium]